MSFEEKFRQAIKNYLVDVRHLTDIAEVTSFAEQVEEVGGGCPTCGYESTPEMTVDVYYTDSAGKKKYVQIQKSLGELITTFDKYWPES